GGGSLDQGGDTFADATVIPGLPYDVTGTTCGYVNDYQPYCNNTNSRGLDVVYVYTPALNVYVDISLCDPYTNYDSKLLLYRASDNELIACNDDGCPGSLSSLLINRYLAAGETYYIVVDGYGTGTCGVYRLQITRSAFGACNRLQDGIVDNGNNTFTFRQTTDENSSSPYYEGPFDVPDSECRDDAGFGIYSWFDGDYGWKHHWPDWNNPNLNVHSVRVVICSYDIDEYTCNIENPGQPEECELDHIFADGSLQNPEWLSGDNNIWTSTTFDVAPAALLDNGWLDMFIDIDVHNDDCSWATTLEWAQLVVVYSVQQQENHPPYTPTGYHYPDCVDETTDQCVVVTGPNPPDPDGDNVTYQYRWFVKNSGTGGGFVNDEANPLFPFDHTGSCVPAAHSFPGDQWKVQVYAVDEHGALSLNPWIVTFPEVIVDCGEPWPFSEVDMGDLAMCNYPTLVNNPGHGLSGIAWLGGNVSGELAPLTLDNDIFDDGVVPIGIYWTPCQVESVIVTVTGGQNYGDYIAENGLLYLNAWKDGNRDGDFCDRVPCIGAVADEWIIHDMLVTPGVYRIGFMDPGIRVEEHRYDAIMRFRLTSRPVGRNGFGLIDTIACSTMGCGVFAMDFLGEVEDHIFADQQLFVELGSFDAVGESDLIRLRWSTRSEAGNESFEILRDGARVGDVESLGDSPTGHSYEWADYGVENGVVYTYTLVSVNLDGSRATLGTVSASPSDHVGAVTEYALYQNYPNPFNPATSIAFDLAEAGHVTLTIYNLQGQEIATIVNGQMAAGAHTAVFDASGLPSGMYWYKLTANDFTAVRKMMLMK
ncbi:T9SS type A sorting domain-containing protein, partial [bacterium]|nr:T9SS type A sorting domain-containing protein [bacterium]